MGIEKRSILCTDDDIRLVEPVERTSRGHAVHGDDKRLPHLVALGSEPLAGIFLVEWCPIHAGGTPAVLDVHAGAKWTRRCRTQHHYAHVRIDAKLDPQLCQR